MAFNTYAVGQTAGQSEQRKEIDWAALHAYTVEAAGLQERETLVGAISGLVDLGIQIQEDAEVEFTGSEEDEDAEIERSPGTYFKDVFDSVKKKTVRMKCWPQKPVQSVAIAVDFPDIIIDKGQFFGKENPQPLRLWMGGQFYMESTGTVIARPTPLRFTNIEKDRSKKPVWSFSQNHLFYKMALAAKLIKPGEAFMPSSIDQLIGKSFQFEAQVFMKKNKGKDYFTEYIKFVGGLGRGQLAFELENTFMLQFNEKNDPEALNQLRNHVINTIKRAKNLNGSVIQKELDLPDNEFSEEDEQPAEKKEEPKVQKTEAKPLKSKKVAPPVDADEGDDEAPF